MTSEQTARRPETSRGVTLIELVIVVSLAIIMAALATPYLGNMISQYRLNSATKELSGLLKMGRLLAVTRSAKVRALFTEVEGSIRNTGSVEGVVRLEIYTFNGATWSWQPVDALVPPPNGSCLAAGKRVPYCVAFKTDFTGISLAWVDHVGTGSAYAPGNEFENTTGLPAIFYGPDGLVGNNYNDFRQGLDKQAITVVVTNKRVSSGIQAKILAVDRAGGVLVRNYRGSGPPQL